MERASCRLTRKGSPRQRGAQGEAQNPLPVDDLHPAVIARKRDFITCAV